MPVLLAVQPSPSRGLSLVAILKHCVSHLFIVNFAKHARKLDVEQWSQPGRNYQVDVFRLYKRFFSL